MPPEEIAKCNYTAVVRPVICYEADRKPQSPLEEILNNTLLKLKSLAGKNAL